MTCPALNTDTHAQKHSDIQAIGDCVQHLASLGGLFEVNIISASNIVKVDGGHGGREAAQSTPISLFVC